MFNKNNLKIMHLGWGLMLFFFVTGCSPQITRQEYQWPKSTAIKLKNGRWVAQYPRCDHLPPPKMTDLEVAKLTFGCSTARNLGMMIAFPKDFVLPKPVRAYPSAPLVASLETRRGRTTQRINP